MDKVCKELMRWGKLQGVQEQDRSKTKSSKKRETELLFARSSKL